jgi:hypothetical protein
MTARQRIGTWCVAALFAGVAIGFGLALTARPSACDHITAIPYKTGERPLCVQVNTIKETE